VARHAWEKTLKCTRFMGKCEGKKTLGRQRLRWEDGIWMYLREIGCSVRSGFIWLRLGTVARSCECGDDPSRSSAKEFISWFPDNSVMTIKTDRDRCFSHYNKFAIHILPCLRCCVAESCLPGACSFLRTVFCTRFGLLSLYERNNSSTTERIVVKFYVVLFY
jgi:hypothetical protein